MTEYQQFLIEALRGGLHEVQGLVMFFPPEHVGSELRPGEWTLRQHLTHMRIIEERYIERLEGVLASGAYVPSPSPQGTPQSSESLQAILDAYADARRRAIEVFRGLSPDQWELTFDHPTVWGDVTVEWWAERYLQHTAEHLDELWMLRQLARLTPEAYQRVTAPQTAATP